MRLLDRYLLRELFIPLAYCLSGFLIFWISFDLFSELSHFQEEKLKFEEIARYYAFRTPEFVVLILPIALLLALLYSLTNHARHNELTAMRAAGVGLMRLCAPYLMVGLLLSIGAFAVNESWVPKGSQMAEAIVSGKQLFERSSDGGRWHYNLSFRNARDGRIWTIGAYNIGTFEMRGPQVEWLLPDESRRTLIASNAVRRDAMWVFHEVLELTYPSRTPTTNVLVDTNIVALQMRTNVLEVPEFSETPDQIKSEIKIGRLSSVKAAKGVQLSMAEILDYLHLHPDLTPRDQALLQTQLQGRLAAPWTSVVVVLIAIPFGAGSGRRNVFVGVASSIFITFAYFMLLKLGLALGTGGYVSPWLAAWSPNIVFAGTGLILTRRVR
jgi:lipopolysaccharide export system permease protein